MTDKPVSDLLYGDDLTIHVDGEYFDQIVAGLKPFEFRLDNEYWRKRLVGRKYRNLIICRGYPKKDDAEKRYVQEYKGYEMQTIVHKKFDNKPERVFSIKIGERIHPQKIGLEKLIK